MILMIDNYDSFTYNLVDYLGRISDEPLKVIRNDEIAPNAIKNLKPSCIVISPGPKSPSEAGISEDVVRMYYNVIPILGVCLGHQAIGEVFGCKVIHAKRLMHGKTSQVKHTGDALFAGVENPFTATRYHSLTIENVSPKSDLQVIAESIDDGEIMAVKHKKFPVYGVQFHPESILTTEGLKILGNFLKLARKN
jgi:anthranilate synthase/aminodeoxychorismate synthase-like glutamine amidotransferase